MTEPPTTDTQANQLASEARVMAALRPIVEAVVAAHRCELVFIEHRREAIGWVLRIYVERLGHDPRNKIGGVTLETCAQISRDLGVALDVAEVINHAYNLEISSPGLERPLSRASDGERFQGMRAKFQLSRDLPNLPRRKVMRGALVSGRDAPEGTTEGEASAYVTLLEDDVGQVTIPWADVVRAHLLHEEAPRTKPGHSPRPKGAKPASRTRRAADQGGADGRGDLDRDAATSSELSAAITSTSSDPSEAPQHTKDGR